MNKNGEITVGTFIVLFVSIVVALTLYSGGIAPSIGDSTLLRTSNNQTIAAGALGANVTLLGKAVVGTPVITNATKNATEVFPSGAFTFNSNQLINGALALTMTTNNASWASRNVNVTYDYEPLTYVSDGGSRAMINLIAIFAILAVIAVVVNKISDGGLFDSFSK